MFPVVFIFFFIIKGPKPDPMLFFKTGPNPTRPEKPAGLPDPMNTLIVTLGDSKDWKVTLRSVEGGGMERFPVSFTGKLPQRV